MEYATLYNGVKIPLLGLGTFPLREKTLIDTIHIANNLGYSLYDTATAYHNETDIGQLISSGQLQREKLFLSSKVSSVVLLGRKRYLFLDKRSVKKAYEDSCKRLQVDYCDAYLLHQPFSGCEKHYKELIKLYESGKVRSIGVSNFDENELIDLRRKCGVYPMINQTEISPFNTQERLIKFCQDNQIVVEAYSPFGRGNLVEELMTNQMLIGIANDHNKSVGQIVLRWIVQQGVVTIPRSVKKEKLEANIDVFNFELSSREMMQVSSLNANRVFGINQINKYNKQ